MRSGALWLLVVLAAASCTSPAPAAVTAPPSATAASTASPAPTASRAEGSPSVTAAIAQFRAIQRLDARVGWVSGNSGLTPALLRTTDGGATWASLPTLGAWFTKLVFVDARAGWAIATTPPSCRAPGASPCTSAIFVTTDGGDHWIEVLRAPDDPDRGPAFVDLAAIDAQHAWIVFRITQCDPEGCAHQIQGTDDGGAHWKVLRQPFIATAIVRTSVTTGWLIGSNTPARGGPILGTADAGATWTQQFQSSLQPVLLTARTDRTAWALYRDGSFCTASSCAKYDLVRTTDGVAWTSLGNPFAGVASGSGSCGGFLDQISFGDETAGWITTNGGAGGVVGPAGGVLRTSDGGRSWMCQTGPASTVLVSGASAQSVWVTSRDRTTNTDTLWGSDDGGRTWKQVPISVR